jgi:hypothetical protein
MALLKGDAPALIAARQLLESGKSIPGAVSSAPAGVAEFLVRIALDLTPRRSTSWRSPMPGSRPSWRRRIAKPGL